MYGGSPKHNQEAQQVRQVYLNDPEMSLAQSALFCDNVVSIPSISNTYGVPTNAPTLFFVIFVDAIFAILEDMRRHRSDTEANSAPCHVVDLDAPILAVAKKKWADIHVGDIVQVFNREVVPADILILAVSENNSEQPGGVCYVETKSLDGETNLKIRHAMDSTYADIKQVEDIRRFSGRIECEKPNALIGKFNGTLHIRKTNLHSETELQSPITSKNLLLRGCNLRNTDWAMGVVINSGSDTKIVQNSAETPRKWSSIMQKLNSMILRLCFALLCLCGAAATVFVLWQDGQSAAAWYLLTSDVNPFEEWVTMLFYYFLLMYQIIPISLYVSMTTVKFAQSKMMAWDLQIYHEETDTPAIVRTMELNEELGQVSYVFTDKTGTLTCNVMDFRKCSINGKSYGTGLTEIGRAAMIRQGLTPPSEPKMDPSIEKVPYVNFIDPSLFDDLRGESGSEQQFKIEQFFVHLSLCHTVIPEKLDSGAIRLSASSPDEQALVAGASYFGFRFQSRSVGGARVRINSETLTFEILEVLEFTSTRKRMSVVVRTRSGGLFLYTKGADTVIYERLANAESGIPTTTLHHMEDFANDGLRTLAIAIRPLEQQWYSDWCTKFRQANNNLDELEKRKNGNFNNEIDRLMEEIEADLELLGATAIEDKLQEGVPSTLSNISDAGIKVWMLTGDKQETAINIGYACSLIDNSVEQVIINADLYPTEQDICEKLMDLVRMHGSSSYDSRHALALIIDGEALYWALQRACAPHLLGFACLCKAVICCRVSPAQKAEMVNLVKQNMQNARTLAIGDGANDVAMIQSAHIGVGISGQEGMQAVNSSDYAIAQFRFLERLLLVHGRYNYLRVSALVVYMFYKNSALVLVQYWYGYLSGASGAKLYWEIGAQVFNIFFTGLPILSLAIMDRDVPEFMSTQYPQLYRKGPNYECFNNYVFLRWISAAVYESLVVFIFTIYAYNPSDGAVGSASRIEYGLVAFSLTIIIVNLKVCLIAHGWTKVLLMTWWASIASWFLTAYVGTELNLFCTTSIGFDECGGFVPTAETPSYWLLLLVCSVVALGRHYAWNQYQRMIFPDLYQILLEKWKQQELQEPDTEVPDLRLHEDINDYVAGLPDGPADERGRASRRSHSDPRYSEFIKKTDNCADSSEAPHYPALQRSATGYAFSCDEDATRNESILVAYASNRVPQRLSHTIASWHDKLKGDKQK